MEQESKRDLYATLAVVLVVIFIAVGVVVKNKDKDIDSAVVADGITSTEPVAATNTNDAATLAAEPAPAAAESTPASSTIYKDGTYTATQKYSTPEDTESIRVTVTVKSDVITEVSASPSALSRDSKEYANAFVNNYKTYVVGKSLKGLKLNRVSGASLTTQGFNNAIITIQSQAQA